MELLDGLKQILKMNHKTLTVKGEKVAHNGAVKCTIDGETLYVHGMLPDEIAIVDTNKKHGVYFGDIKEFIKISPHRKDPDELHYLCCSPWQIIEYPTQAEFKKEIISELYSYYREAPNVDFTPADKYYGYRTKVEFSFMSRDNIGNEIPLSLAYHIRNEGKRRMELPSGCELVSENVNKIALEICKRLREVGLTTYELKTLCIRESKIDGKCIAILYSKEKEIPLIETSDIPNLSGFHVWYSTHKSPASVATEKIYGIGNDYLIEEINGVKIKYPWDGFFQNNISVFGKALNRISEYISKDEDLLELYSGVGTIGLLLANKVKKVFGVEINESSVIYAKKNAEENNISNYEAICLPAEKIDSNLIKNYNQIILDPPRSGLHPKLIENIIESSPETIIYLSCNPETQARDYSKLEKKYKIQHIEGFDFYPQTPHVESLIILKKR